jgi:hypothetical protein
MCVRFYTYVNSGAYVGDCVCVIVCMCVYMCLYIRLYLSILIHVCMRGFAQAAACSHAPRQQLCIVTTHANCLKKMKKHAFVKFFYTYM